MRRWLFHGDLVIATEFGFAFDENGEPVGCPAAFECGSSRPPFPLTSSWAARSARPERPRYSRFLPAPIGSALGSMPCGQLGDAIWPSGWDGVGSVYLSYYPDLAVPGAVEAVLAGSRGTSATTPAALPPPASGTARRPPPEPRDHGRVPLRPDPGHRPRLWAERGVFFAFSSFVMKALARLQPAQGIAAMQSINLVAVGTALFGTAAAAVALAVWALVDWNDSFGRYLLAASVVYLVGAIGLTIAYHVPRNEALAAAEPQRSEAARHWARYLTEWTKRNHVRAAAALAAAAAFTVALHVD